MVDEAGAESAAPAPPTPAQPAPPAIPVVSVVVPVYRNEGSLPALFDALLSIERGLADRGLALELIFVDDGSPDGSLAVLRELKRRRPATKVVKLSRNFGAVHASKTGFRYVTGGCFCILAADLQDPPELILQMADLWLQGSKFVVCVRQRREDSLLSRFFSWVHYRSVRLLAVRDFPLGGFDLALMSRELLPHMLDSARHVNTPLFAYWLGFRPTTIHYVRRRRTHGKSGWTFRKRVNFYVDSLVGFSIVPLRAMSFIGMVVALLSFGYGGTIAVNALRGLKTVPGFAALAVLLSFLLGLVIAMLGVVGEYLWRIYDEVSRKPEAVVDEVL
ncbi:MAG TPA: glycosyltransferase family 2 protein [Thermoanaerobaculia bacterium]|jgi:dolichol-phosphate mannosyltransferase|nr:glycosyltransferase family 2 protein [Thermoanaerobaculia bacterium]